MADFYAASMSLKIFTDGARFWGGQIDRIDAGFVSLGHELTTDISEADLIYVNNGGYSKIVEAKIRGLVKGKIILNVLDLAPHISTFPLVQTREELAVADAVTCISQTVQKDIKARLSIDATVIYNPAKPIRRDPSSVRFTALFVGRVNDPEKRSRLGVEAIRVLNIPGDMVVTTGGEPPFYGGQYAGVSTDQLLNDLYNSADFLMCPTRNAFLGLPILEACAAGTIPVFCNDLDIREEFFPTDLFPEYAAIDPSASSIAGFMWGFMMDPVKKANLQDRLYRHYQENLADRLSPIGVARRILAVYNRLS